MAFFSFLTTINKPTLPLKPAFLAKSQIILFISLAFFCFNCSKTPKEDSKTVHLGRVKSIVLKGKLFGPADYLKDPAACQILRDSILLVVDRKMDKLVHLINLNSGELISQYGVRGILDDVTIRPPFFVDSTGNFVDLVEPSHKRLASFSIDSLISGSDSYFPKDFITTPPEVGSPLELIRVNDSLYIGNTPTPCERLFRWNSKSDKIDCSPILVPKDSTFDRQQESQFNGDIITVRPDKKYIVAAMFHYNRIDVFDLDLNHQFSVVGDQANFPHDLCVSVGNQKTCDWDRFERFFGPGLYATNNFFYVMSRVPLRPDPKGLEDFQCMVSKFKWNGELVARMELGIYTRSFAVSESRNEIYIIDDLTNVHQKILVFKM